MPSWRAMSSLTASVAVAVSASTVGLPSARHGAADPEERRAEVVPPLRDAVRLVDDQQATGAARQQLEEGGVGQPLGVMKTIFALAGGDRALRRVDLVARRPRC